DADHSEPISVAEFWGYIPGYPHDFADWHAFDVYTTTPFASTGIANTTADKEAPLSTGHAANDG
ncbi:hypothetical protein HDU96_003924, partial [Phlyctochytrium bullatum]